MIRVLLALPCIVAGMLLILGLLGGLLVGADVLLLWLLSLATPLDDPISWGILSAINPYRIWTVGLGFSHPLLVSYAHARGTIPSVLGGWAALVSVFIWAVIALQLSTYWVGLLIGVVCRETRVLCAEVGRILTAVCLVWWYVPLGIQVMELLTIRASEPLDSMTAISLIALPLLLLGLIDIAPRSVAKLVAGRDSCQEVINATLR